MKNFEKILQFLSSLVEKGILSSQDAKKEIFTNFKFTKDVLVEKFQLVPREEFEILKKIIKKQENEIKKLKTKKTNKAKKS